MGRDTIGALDRRPSGSERREWIRTVAAGLLAAPTIVSSQIAGRIYRLGVLRPTAPAAEAVAPALRGQGYVEAQNLFVDARFANGRVELLPMLARELLRARVDALLAVGSGAVEAAIAETKTVPIVMFGNFDPVARGWVTNLARPGGNVTGVLIAPDGTLAAKRLELLQEAVPRARRIGLLLPSDPNVGAQRSEAEKAAASLGLTVVVAEVASNDYETAFAALKTQKVDALFVAGTTFFLRDRRQIIDLAAKHRLPATYEWREHVVDGGLMTYATSLPELHRRLAAYIVRIFEGARPGDLPVERPTRFELVVNLKTAKSLSLTLPQSLLLRADEVIR